MAVIGGVSQPTPADVGALDSFLHELEPCLGIYSIEEYHEPIPTGCYCMYYKDTPFECATHDFGWYSPRGCGALYRLVEGAHHDCDLALECNDPVKVMPPTAAQIVKIDPGTGSVHFWINKEPTPPITAGNSGHYFTEQNRNWDSRPHAFIYIAKYKLQDECVCKCNYNKIVLPPEGVVYLLFWEDACSPSPGAYSWDDFRVAFVPCEGVTPVCETPQINLNTGTADWKVTSAPPGAYTGPAKTITSSLNTGWATCSPAKWISVDSSGTYHATAGDYTYKLNFYFDAEDCCPNCKLTFQYAADNRATFELITPCGTYNLCQYCPCVTGSADAFNTLRTCQFKICQYCSVSGTYTLKATVHNDELYTGLLICGEIKCQ
jgi:hypothetical protein